jgi:hypothetical protein
MIEIKPAVVGLSAEVEPILRALPQWFGIEEATVFYIQQTGENPTFLAIDSNTDDRPVGFLTLYTHSPFAAEVCVRLSRRFGADQGGWSTRRRKRSNLALPYICRLISFSRVIWPSVCPLLQGYSRAAFTAA